MGVNSVTKGLRLLAVIAAFVALGAPSVAQATSPCRAIAFAGDCNQLFTINPDLTSHRASRTPRPMTL